MRIALDAMGGDYAPAEIVRGAVDAAGEIKSLDRIFLVGDQEKIGAELDGLAFPPGKIEIVHASEAIGMDETPALAVRRKKDSSIGRAVDLVKSGDADAVVSAGNTGAVVVASTLKLRTLEGIDRPAIAAVLPKLNGSFVLIDAGANTDCTAEMLVQFAVMGSVYSGAVVGRSNPVVGLLSIGGEHTKGNETTKEAFEILKMAPINFKGNVEGHDAFEGETDVLVCDGFVGNIFLKTSEGTAGAVGHWLKQELTRSPMRKMAALMLSGAFKTMKKRMDREMYGGAMLLGVNGVCIITHGASSRRAILHAVRVAAESVGSRLNELIVSQMTSMSPGK